MESGQLKILYKTLDDIRHQNGVEYWYARELYPMLGYSRWDNFETALERAKEACKKSGSLVNDHFRDATKTVKGGMDIGAIQGVSLDKIIPLSFPRRRESRLNQCGSGFPFSRE